MKPSAPFQISIEDVERSSLDAEDVGLWAILVTGCYHLFETKGAARRCYRLLLGGVTVR